MKNLKFITMRNLIKKALDDAFILLEKRTPQTKKEIKYINIEDVKPSELTQFMKDNNIPDDADFVCGKPNGYDSFDEVCLSFSVDIPTTEKEKLKFCRSAFTSIAWQYVYDLLIKNGYKRVGYNTALLKPFEWTTVYDMYINNDYDMLVEYYSLPFVKE